MLAPAFNNSPEINKYVATFALNYGTLFKDKLFSEAFRFLENKQNEQKESYYVVQDILHSYFNRYV